MQNRPGTNLRTGGQVLIDQLRIHGVDMAFCVPGESYLAALDALHDAPEIQLVVCRQEGGAAMMADAYGKLTGRPGIVFVTRGPGATNASAGIHISFQDSTPVILFIGQVGRDMADREAFQEIDFRRMFGQMAKWVAQIDDAARIPEYVSRAFHTATAGRPGPVVLALPEDMLTDRVACADARRYRTARAAPAPDALAELHERLSRAERPLAIVGGGDWDAESVADFQRFAAAWDLPVGTSFRCQSHFDNTRDQFVGDVGIGLIPSLAERVKSADLLLVAGARLGEMTTGGYSLVEAPLPRQALVHAYPDPEELGRVYQAALPINAGMKPLAQALAGLVPPEKKPWASWRHAARADYLDWIKPLPNPGKVQMADILVWLRERLPADAFIVNGAGNYSGWIHKYYQFRRYRTQVGPTSGSMGYGTPAAIAVKLMHPDRIVVNIAGDGCFMMHGQEMATAALYNVPVVNIVVNNGLYGTIRMHQEREYPKRVIATQLKNPDFAALARAYGAHGETVTETEAFGPAFERCLAAGKPALIDLVVDPEAITTRTTITKIREAALAAGR
ncbi:MAG: thiamine pyrophosphate-binding protein [Rhodospirillaceae bacterium]|nr:thiamine pyrophosphate-binding protein [Rhodospirillaceae bacterium]